MKRSPRVVLCGVFFGLLLISLPAQTFFWSGVGNGWQGQVAPSNTGGEDLVFANSLSNTIPFDTITNVNSLTFTNDNDYELASSGPVTLIVHGGIFAASTDFSRVRFDSPITLSLPGTATIWDAGTSSVIVAGKVTGTGPLTLEFGSNTSGSGAFIFNNSSPLNNYTGSTTITSYGTGGAGTVAFWNSSPFSTGAVTITNGAYFASHNTLTLSNNFSVVSNSTNPWSMRNWDAPLTLSGTITLAANNDVIASRFGFTGIPASNNEGTFPIPGPLTRFPTIFTGNIVGGSNALIVGGSSVTIFNFAANGSTYTGGTTVNGSLIFGQANNAALPLTGALTSASTNGYIGSADVYPGDFAIFLSRISTGTNGAVGIDSLPGNPTSVLNDSINLTGFASTDPNGVRLGTATSAILAGTITPQITQSGTASNYHFGNGGGSLYVQSNLPNVSSFTSKLILDDGNLVPLKLYLQGNNSYTGNTTANAGFIIFDGASAIPASGTLTASGSVTNVGASYVGFSDSTGLTPAAFLLKFSQANTWGIIGFDTHAGNGTATYASPVNLTGFNDGVFIGTATTATLTGTLTPSSVPNSYNTANTLRFTAGNGGTLTVNSPGSLTGALSVVIGTPSSTSAYSDGTVILTGTNTYYAGTTVNPGGGITLGLGSNGALGTSALKIAPSIGNVGVFGLQATAAGLVIPNDIIFQTPDYLTNSAATMALTGTNSFTLAGSMFSGPASMQNTPAGISLYNATPINVTLSGDNTAYSGSIDVTNGTLYLASNTAAGQGLLSLNSASATVAFNGPATNPIIYGLHGDTGSLVVPNGTSLTIDTDNPDHDYSFGGIISGPAGAATSASLTITGTGSNTNLVYLSGANTYTGGTTITGTAALGLGNNSSAGTGPVTINATVISGVSYGGLALNTGVTFTNPLVFNSGTLAGLGTFAPSSISGTGQTAGKITIGANQFVMPAIPGDHNKTPGTLTFATNTAFLDGGTYNFVLQDSTATYGYSLLQINGNLDLTTISTAGFMIELESVDQLGAPGYGNLVLGQTYMIPFVHTSGTISGFNLNPNQFTFDPTKFVFGSIPASAFSVSIDGTNQTLYLNFTAVPEPSTYALMAVGLGVVILPALRRRRA